MQERENELLPKSLGRLESVHSSAAQCEIRCGTRACRGQQIEPDRSLSESKVAIRRVSPPANSLFLGFPIVFDIRARRTACAWPLAVNVDAFKRDRLSQVDGTRVSTLAQVLNHFPVAQTAALSSAHEPLTGGAVRQPKLP